jgi:hypothetical protein
MEAEVAERSLVQVFRDNLLECPERFISQDMVLFVREHNVNKPNAVYNTGWLLMRVEGRLAMFEEARKQQQTKAAFGNLVTTPGKKRGNHNQDIAPAADGGKGGGGGGKGKDKSKGKAKAKAKAGPTNSDPATKIKGKEGSDAMAVYGLASGYLACHNFNKNGCNLHDKDCKFTHSLLPADRRSALPDKPGARERSKTPGAPAPGKGKDKDKGKGRDRSKSADKKKKGEGKGKGRTPVCCPDFLKESKWDGDKCPYVVKNKAACKYPKAQHLDQEQWNKEFKRLNVKNK